MSNYLILRTLTSPYNDVTKGSVLSHPELDGNFIFLKGNIIYTAETSGATVTLKKYNGDSFSFIAGGSGIFTGGTIVGPTVFTNGATANTLTVNGVSITGDTYTIGSTLIGTTAYFDTNNALSAYTLDLSSIAGSASFSGGTVNGPTIFTSGLTANTLTVNGVEITGDTYTVGANLIGTTAYFDTNNVLSAYTLDLSSIAGSASFTGGTVTGSTTFTSGLTANSLTVNGVQITGDTYTTGTTLIGTTAYFNTNNALSAYSLNLSGFATSNSLSGSILTGGTYSDGIYTFENKTGGTFGVTATTTYAAGAISGSTGWTSTGTGQINLPAVKVALFDNPKNIEPILVYDVASGTTGSIIPALTDNSTNYVVIEYNNGLPRYNVSTADITNDSDIVLAYIIYRLGTFIHVLEFGNYGAGLSNKLNDRFIMTNRFGWESGLSLGLSGSTGVVTLTSGVAWNGSYRQSLDAVNSQDDVFFQNYHVGGSWTAVTTADTLNNTYYDNGTNIITGDTGKYLVNYYYRGQERNDHLYEVFSTDQYDNISEAEAALAPNTPELVSSHAFLVGRIIIGVGETTGITQTAFGPVFQPTGFAGGSNVHNNLNGLQGGSAGEYYHLTQNEYNNLPTKYSANVLFSSSVQQTITHNLNTQDILVQLWDSTSKLINGADIIANTVNTVQVTVATGGNYRIVIIG